MSLWLILGLALLLPFFISPKGQAQSGVPAGRGFSGNFDSDLKADLAFWTYGTGVWTIKQSATGTVRTQPWGSPNAPYYDIPVLADYDGDGQTDVAV